MILKDSSSGRRVYLLIIIICSSLLGSAQTREPNPLESFLDTQFWLGLRFGTNYTQVKAKNRQTGFSPIDYSTDSLQKSYDNFATPGLQVGLEINMYHRGFSASFQPAFKRSNYNYRSNLEWTGADPNSRFETNYTIDQRLDLIELPLNIKYEIIRNGEIRPFVMVGGFYSIISSSQKDVTIRQVDYSSGQALLASTGTTTLGDKDSFQNFTGYALGAGVNLDYWNIRSVIEISYRRSLTPLTRNTGQQNELASLGETNDKLFLRDINISIGFVFPFRFIDSQFQAR
jgi:opacity protein-like surface antigen